MPGTQKAKPKFRVRNTTKIVDLLVELNMNETQLGALLRKVNIRVEEGQKNLDQQEVGRIRAYLNEQKRRAELRGSEIALPPIVKVADFARALELPVGEVLSTLLRSGVMATLNDDIDYETAAIIAEELGYKTREDVSALEQDTLTPEKLEEILKKEDPKEQDVRPPVVTIIGHVDHGKTTLLDSIRSANVAAQEAGGITQAISSYQVKHKQRVITFIDTPGHETFQFMRKRGVRAADIAILVVAADDGVKPQTKEAAMHAKEAGVPLIVALNKIDKSEANIDRVKKELAEQLELLPEEWGGKTVMVPISALKKQGIEELLEMVLLTADVNPPKAIVKRPALGSVLESRLDKHLGPLAAVLIHTGTLEPGNDVVVGRVVGRVRRLLDWRNKPVAKATPGMPATIVGLQDVPQAGDILQVVEERAQATAKAASGRGMVKTLSQSSEDDTRPTLALVLKADSRGSLEAIEQTVRAMVPAQELRLAIVRAEVGSVSDSDVLTAQASGALIYAFNTTIGGMSQKLADKEKVVVKRFDVIYRLADDMRAEIEKRLPMEVVREELGRLKVLKVFATFATTRKKIIGGEVAEGKIETGAQVVVWRDVPGQKERDRVGSGVVVEMQREKQKIDRAQRGDQVGLTIEGKGKIKEGDVLEMYTEKKVRKVMNNAS